MATYHTWNPFGVALEIAASGSNVVRKSDTQFTVNVTAQWKTYYNGAKTNYGMDVSSGGKSVVISSFGTSRSSGSAVLTGATYQVSNGAASTQSISVTFRNYNSDNNDSATKTISFNVSVPAMTYSVKYNANGGTGAPASQTKTYGQTLKLATTKPTRTGYSFLGWSTSSSATSATYSAGGSYTANSAATLYAVWKANTYTVKYNANGGTGAPASQTKTYGQTLKLATTKPTKTNYNFKGWATSASATTATYASGANYTNNAAVTLYAVWELAYMKPSLTSISVDRCDKDGVVTDDGTYAMVTFDWSTFYTATTASIIWISSEGVSNTFNIPLSGQGGTVRTIVGDGELNLDLTYSFTLSVTDSGGSTVISKTLSGFRFPIDVLNGEVGLGVSIGKPAEKKDVFEVDLKAEFNKPVNIKQNRYSFSTPGIAGTAGYIKIATLTIIAENADSPITFVLSQRRAISPMTVHICLQNSAMTSSTLSSITYEGSNYGVFLCQSSTLVWDLYVQKGSIYDTITIQDWWMSKTMDARITVTFSEELVSAIPTPYHRATPAKLQGLVDFIYPVGSIYISYNHNDPGTLFGGTWVRIENAFLWGCDDDGDIGITGGEKTHTLTVDELPSHTHNIPVANTATGSNTASNKIRYNNDASSYIGTIASNSAGGGAAHNNMPPYIQVAIWRRTA